MKLNNNAQELLDRYLLGVRRALPAKKREDIAAEIESTLLDRMEEHFAGAEEINAAQVKEVLTEMGSPRKVASSYGEQRALIGPRLFPAYLLVLRIVVPVVMGALTLAFVVRAAVGEALVSGSYALEYLGALWNGAFMAAAFVTLVFAIIERVNADKEIEELAEFEKFNADDLPQLSDKEERPSSAGSVAEIVLGVLGLAFFTYVLNNGGRFPIYLNPSEKIGQVRFFTDNFLRFVPFMMALAGLEVARSAMVLAQGRESSLANWWHITTEAGHLVLTAFLLGAFPLIALDWMNNFASTAGWDMARVNTGANTGLKVVLGLALFGSLVEIIKRLVKAIRKAAQ